MKKTLFSLLCAVLILATGLFCTALAEDELAGAWDDDEDELSLVFDGEGTVTVSDDWDALDFSYEWDGSTLTIIDEEGDVFLSATMDEYGDLISDELEGYFYRVDVPDYAPALGWDGTTLPGTEWELDETVIDFCWGGSVLMDGEYMGAYSWDGEQSAEMYLEADAPIALTMDESGLYYEDEDGEIYAFTYLGGVTLLYGAYDNDGEEVSIVFYLDETCTLSDVNDAVDGAYELGGDGSLYLETEDGSWVGRYDARQDTFVLDGMDDEFYRMSEPDYVPEPEIIGDPGETEDEATESGDGIADTAWDFQDTDSSVIFHADGTGEQTSPTDSIPFEYTWDGETLVMSTEWISVEGSMDADGNLIIGDDVLVRVDTASYVPGTNAGGMESELEGDWIHEGGNIILSFDGEQYVGYQIITNDGNTVGAGTYSFDGETLVISLLGDSGEVEDNAGYMDEEGNLIIELWDGTGSYTRNYGYRPDDIDSADGE